MLFSFSSFSYIITHKLEGFLDKALLVAAEEVLGLCVPECAAADHVDEDEGDSGDDERHVCFAPLLAQVAQHAGLARLAAVAQLALVVAPCRAILVRPRVARVHPHRRVHIHVPACRRRLAATGLHRGKQE